MGLLAWTTRSGLYRCYFCFFLEKEDNNLCIAFLKARLTCHKRGSLCTAAPPLKKIGRGGCTQAIKEVKHSPGT